MRHGEHSAHPKRECSSKLSNASRTPEDVRHAEQTTVSLHGEAIHEVSASPLKDAYATAAIIAAPRNQATL
jgi:broad specificity phosphatase PhoE